MEADPDEDDVAGQQVRRLVSLGPSPYAVANRPKVSCRQLSSYSARLRSGGIRLGLNLALDLL